MIQDVTWLSHHNNHEETGTHTDLCLC